MKLLRSTRYALGVPAAVVILSACSGISHIAPTSPATVTQNPQWSAHVSLIPKQMWPRGPMPLFGRAAPATAMRGIYVSEVAGTSILGYKKGQRPNNPAICSTPFSVGSVNNIAVDGAGNLIDPDGAAGAIIIGQGPNMCGPMAATIADPFGQPVDASSANALTGKIAVANTFDNGSTPGSISVCSVSAGCKQNLTNPAMDGVAGVAMDNTGNCWADAINSSVQATLTYFAGCTGSGVRTTGFTNVGPGGIDIDASGNLVTIDVRGGSGGTGAVDVYSGCKRACKLLSSTPLIAPAIYGHLNSLHNNKLAVADFGNSQIDIYRYSPAGGVTYLYSFNNGLSASLFVEGVAYNKRSPQ